MKKKKQFIPSKFSTFPVHIENKIVTFLQPIVKNFQAKM